MKGNKMNAREFFYLVSEMRTAQKEYFKSRDQVKLRVCRALENQVDDEIFRVKAMLPKG